MARTSPPRPRKRTPPPGPLPTSGEGGARKASKVVERDIIRHDDFIRQGFKPLPNETLKENLPPLPPDWRWVRLGDLAKFIDYRGRTPTKTKSGIPLITAKNVKMGYIKEEPREFIAEKDYQGWMTRGIPQKGDILFTTEAPLGNVAQLRTDAKIALAQRMITFQTYEIIEHDFLKYGLMAPSFQSLLNARGTGTTVKGIKAAILKQLPLPLPPLATQQAIVAKIEELFSELDKGIESIKLAQQQLKTYRQSVLKAAFEGRLTDIIRRGDFIRQGFKPLPNERDGELPAGWKWVKLGDVSRFIDYRGRTPTKTKSGVPLITAKNVKMGFIQAEPQEFIAEKDYVGWMTRGIPNIGDVLFTTEAPLGNVAQLNTKSKVAFAQRLITMQCNSQIQNTYLKFCLMGPAFQTILDAKGTGTTVKGIKAAILKQLEIPAPAPRRAASHRRRHRKPPQRRRQPRGDARPKSRASGSAAAVSVEAGV